MEWGNNKKGSHLVNWNMASLPKKRGGLGVGFLKQRNRSLLLNGTGDLLMKNPICGGGLLELFMVLRPMVGRLNF